MSDIPVIFIHKGYEAYLDCTLRQASKKNPVYLLGDRDQGPDSITFQNIDELRGGCDDFARNYTHLNTTPFDFEVFCYQRWFILKNFMVKNNIPVVFYCDSDVMLFEDVSKEWKKFDQFDMTLLHRTAAVSSFITLEAVDNFCKLLLNTYLNKDSYNYKKIASHFHVRQECRLGGGVCDMTFFEFFHYCSDCGGGPGKVGEMMHIIDGSTYDHNINVPDQDFDFADGRKNFKIKNGFPYVFSRQLNKDIKFNSLHFQGPAKRFIQETFHQFGK